MYSLSSFHEVGIHDVPAAIDYILNVTSAKKLIYIGHSLGTTTFYAFASCRPEYSNKVLVQISVAPVAALSHTTSIARVLVPIAKEIEVSMEKNRGRISATAPVLHHSTTAIISYSNSADDYGLVI